MDSWDLSARDVIPDLAVGGRPRDVGAVMLHALLTSDGVPLSSESYYETIRRNIGTRAKPIEPEFESEANSRIRTWRALFRSVGLLYHHDGHQHNTAVGGWLLEQLNSQIQAVDDYGRALFARNEHRLAAVIAPTLARYQLASPIAQAEYPQGTDIRPISAMWSVMRGCDNKLHAEEFGRTLTKCLREEEVGSVIDKINSARRTADYSPRDLDLMQDLYGERRPSDNDGQYTARISPWFSRAGFKSMFLYTDNENYRHLRPHYVNLIDEVLSNLSEPIETDSELEYFEYMCAGANFGSVASPDTLDAEPSIQKVVDRARRFGDRQIIALVGPAGTGKTRAAKESAAILTDNDETRIHTLQFHAGFSYEEFIGGLTVNEKGNFVREDGILLRVNAAAHKNPEVPHVLLIDEFSRADIANTFGEALTYIEYRDTPFFIPSIRDEVSLAPNLIIMATLNPQDRSVVDMDAALLRRMRQISFPPNTDALMTILRASEMEPSLAQEVGDWFSQLPSDAPFGHGVFVGVRTEGELTQLWEESLHHFLYRGGVPVHPDPESIEAGFRWRLIHGPSD